MAAILPGAERRSAAGTRERMALVESAFGSAVIAMNAQDVGRPLSQILLSDLPFDRWYRERTQGLQGVSMDRYELSSQRPPPPP